jgi:two-component system LytT family response regulator
MFSEITFEVIFVTAFNKYAIQAFEFNALGYILKPVDEVKLVNVVAKARDRINTRTGGNIVLHFIKTLSDTEEVINKISVHQNGNVVFINISDISCIEADGSTTRIILNKSIQYYSSKRLGQFEAMLSEVDQFIRISKSVILNSAFIDHYTKGEPFIIQMNSGQLFEVSRRRKAEILKALKNKFG